MELTGLIRDKEDSVTKRKLMVGLVSVLHKMPNPAEKAEPRDNSSKIFKESFCNCRRILYFWRMNAASFYPLFLKSRKVTIDSRTVEKNDLFFAFSGENFNAAKSAEDAIHKDALAVIVENAGFGATWAVPIASLMIEKYLRRSISPNRLYLEERIMNAKFYGDTTENETESKPD